MQFPLQMNRYLVHYAPEQAKKTEVLMFVTIKVTLCNCVPTSLCISVLDLETMVNGADKLDIKTDR